MCIRDSVRSKASSCLLNRLCIRLLDLVALQSAPSAHIRLSGIVRGILVGISPSRDPCTTNWSQSTSSRTERVGTSDRGDVSGRSGAIPPSHTSKRTSTADAFLPRTGAKHTIPVSHSTELPLQHAHVGQWVWQYAAGKLFKTRSVNSIHGADNTHHAPRQYPAICTSFTIRHTRFIT